MLSNFEDFSEKQPKQFGHGSGAISWLVAWVVTLAALATGPIVLALPVLLIAFMVLALASLFNTSTRTLKLASPDGEHIGFVVFSGYVALTAVWTPIAADPLVKAGLVLSCVVATLIAKWYLLNSDGLQIYRIARGIIVGLFVSLAYLATEVLTNFALLAFAAEHSPIRISTRFEGTAVPDFFLNKATSAAMILLWPVLLTAWYWTKPGWRVVVVGGFVVVSVAILAVTTSQSAQAAFLLGLTGFALASFKPHRIQSLACAAWSLVVIAIVPIMMLLHALGLQQSPFLPMSFRERIAIWHATALEVFNHPWLGAGVHTDRYDSLRRTKVEDITADHLGWHAHDLFLQVWHELGVIGAVFLLLLGLLSIRSIGKLAPVVQPFAYATFASICGIAAFGYGAWQSWLLACYAWSVIFFLIGNETWKRSRSTPLPVQVEVLDS